MEDKYRFLYRIVCEPKITKDYSEFTSELVTNLATMKLRAIDDSIISNLREIGREKNIDLLIGIDESKVMNMVRIVEAFEIIKNKVLEVDYYGNLNVRKDVELTHKECQLLYEALGGKENED